MNVQELVSFYGVTEAKAKEIAKNLEYVGTLTKLKDALMKHVEAKKIPNPPVEQARLCFVLSTKLKGPIVKHVPFLVENIVKGYLDSEVRMGAAAKFLVDNLKDNEVDVKKFEEAIGAGIVVSDDEIERAVNDAIEKNKAEILEKRYRYNVGILMGLIRSLPKMGWADGSKVKLEMDQQLVVLLGPKTDADRQPIDNSKTSKAKENKPEVKKPKESQDDGDKLSPQERIMAIMKKLAFHKPGENYTTDGYPTSQLALDLLAKHADLTKRKIRTRFPPEPNGILHIGHAKAININFGYAKANDGLCFLRYDDTNPEKEEERFFRSISEMVEWLGYKPYKVTHASDYFNELYAFAVVLIQKGLAFVCHQTADQMKGFETETSPWRDRPVDANLKLFEDMKNGKFEEGAATLRMKITLEEGKKDPVAYRVRYVAHPKTGNKWCIYPTYDFTHCLCDSLENITHSMCTKEFQNRRSSYYWLCEAVETYIPVQWEYGRLNMCYTVVSKRKIAKLITEGVVRDWDDPRLFTLPALRRRGFPPEAVNDFCVRMGVTGATIMVEPAMIEACVRDVLNITAPRTMAVLNPIKVVIKNFPFPANHKLSVPDFPADKNSPTHDIQMSNVIYIEESDFQTKASKEYHRFATDQPVGLRYAGLILEVENVVNVGNTIEIHATCKKVGDGPKPKGFIHWVSDPIQIEARLYDRLFKHKNPEDSAQVPGGFLSDCNPDSLQIPKLSYADKYLLGAKPFTQFQFERIGFFSVDPDSTKSKLVFNRTVNLREDSEKN